VDNTQLLKYVFAGEPDEQENVGRYREEEKGSSESLLFLGLKIAGIILALPVIIPVMSVKTYFGEEQRFMRRFNKDLNQLADDINETFADCPDLSAKVDTNSDMGKISKLEIFIVLKTDATRHNEAYYRIDQIVTSAKVGNYSDKIFKGYGRVVVSGCYTAEPRLDEGYDPRERSRNNLEALRTNILDNKDALREIFQSCGRTSAPRNLRVGDEIAANDPDLMACREREVGRDGQPKVSEKPQDPPGAAL